MAVSASERERLVSNLADSHEFVRKAAAGWPAGKETFQASPHDNHLLWTLGHLALTYEWFCSMVDGKEGEFGKKFNGLFGWQSKPEASAAKYPALSDIRAAFEREYERLAGLLKGQSDADLEKAPAVEAMGFITTRAQIYLRGAWHNGWHTGQLSTLRRALGLPSMFA